ncbi:methyl-accepting chemotaxis protein [Paucibacter sp. KBW04]|uniref:methyl-accepting chemotaxis protein n=1 Tax=Paucibacter sp. KBW04 TaxID=2153361 RepID=UPI0011CEFD21|nr:methyl-accepting chemotaxis protein [Paucibacter sp. KBW04]
MKSLRGILWVLVLAGLGMSGILTLSAVLGGQRAELAVQKSFDAKDLTADILPPPLYLIELRLLLSQALDGTVALDKARSEFQRLDKEYKERVAYWQAHPPYGLEQQLLGAQHKAGQQFLQVAGQMLDELAAGHAEQARQQLPQAQTLYVEHRRGVDATVSAATALAEHSIADYEQTLAWVSRLRWAVMLAAALLLVLLGAWAKRTVWAATGGEPRAAAAIAQAVARGDLSRPVRVRAGDQSSVLSAMAQMCAGLSALVSSVRASSDSIATGSSQIAVGNADLSQRTELQAGHLQQTSAAVLSLAEAVQQNAQSAAQATARAQAATEVAGRGAALVGEVILTMNAMARGAKQVSELTSLIDGIAFQTNILALNAAVEAARAGERGRGFAVVADEVRQLAQRAAAASKDIGAVIRASNSQIEQGAGLAQATGSTMDEIVAEVRQVAGLIGEITSASQAQEQDIARVSQAIHHIDASTQQNAALVEESAAAAQSLSQQAQQLVSTVSVFALARV